MLIPNHIRISVDPITVEVKVTIENDQTTQKQIDDLTARVVEGTNKMKDAEKLK